MDGIDQPESNKGGFSMFARKLLLKTDCVKDQLLWRKSIFGKEIFSQLFENFRAIKGQQFLSRMSQMN